MAFLSFAREVFRLTKDKEYDFIFSSTSRLMTGALGALITRKRNIPFYLDIRDILLSFSIENKPALSPSSKS